MECFSLANKNNTFLFVKKNLIFLYCNKANLNWVICSYDSREWIILSNWLGYLGADFFFQTKYNKTTSLCRYKNNVYDFVILVFAKPSPKSSSKIYTVVVGTRLKVFDKVLPTFNTLRLRSYKKSHIV